MGAEYMGSRRKMVLKKSCFTFFILLNFKLGLSSAEPKPELKTLNVHLHLGGGSDGSDYSLSSDYATKGSDYDYGLKEGSDYIGNDYRCRRCGREDVTLDNICQDVTCMGRRTQIKITCCAFGR